MIVEIDGKNYDVKEISSSQWLGGEISNYTGILYINLAKDNEHERPHGKTMIKQYMWLVNGKLHRKDGPAIVYVYNDLTLLKKWCLNNNLVSPKEVFESLTNQQKEKALWELNKWKEK